METQNILQNPNYSCPGVPFDVLHAFINDPRSKLKIFQKQEYIARQGTNMPQLNILLTGSAKTILLSDDGNLLSVEILEAPHMMAPVFLFAKNSHIPVDVIALQASEVLQVSKDCVLEQMMLNKEFLSNFLAFSANRAQFLVNRIQSLNIKTIKGKLAYYILERITENSSIVDMGRNQTELAEYFGVTRPSLARTLGEMTEEQLIEMHGKELRVISKERLRQLV